jgi:hypothetical protein
MPQLPKGRKPTVGFLARFFSEGSFRWKILPVKGLQNRKPRKSEKTPAKMSFSLAGTPVFLLNSLISGPFLRVKLFFELQVVVLMELAGIVKRRFYKEGSQKPSKSSLDLGRARLRRAVTFFRV